MGRRILFLALFCFFLLSTGAEGRDIYVRLSQGGNYSLLSEGDMLLTDGKGQKVPLGRSAALQVRGDRLSIGERSVALPARVTAAAVLGFNGRRYRGAFLITGKGLLNVLDVEQYLRGVLPAEVGASWPQEALRAQAIISRTYALRQSLGRAKRGYDVLDTIADQVYKGAGVETARTDQAISSTAREVLSYDGGLASTPFHSDSGGHTANNEDVWGASLPYLSGVPEPIAYSSPVSSWSTRIPQAKVTAAAAKAGSGDLGPVKDVRVSKVDKGGRAVTLTFTGPKGSKTLKASQFRMAIGPSVLKSTMLRPSASATASQAEPKNSAPFHIAKSGSDFLFHGKGWGHGVGLSQWGALALSRNGWTAERILAHYYPGAKVTTYK